MNYGGNMPDWHQYNSTQPIGSEVPSVGQNVNHSPIFGPSISPRRLNGPTFSPEGLNKPQNDANFNPRNFQQSSNTLNAPNGPSENSPMGSVAQMPGCHGPYGAPGPRNTMIEGTSPSLDSRNLPNSSLSEVIGQRNHQLSMCRPAAPSNCPTVNESMGPIGQRNTTTTLQGPIPTSNRQAPGSYVPCKGPCCNPDINISYRSWEKFAPYPPNVPYRDTGYPIDNRRFSNEFENREQLGTNAHNIDPRRSFPDYKYRKDPIIPRPYAHPSSVIQSYPVQNYNFPADYQKYSAYPVKEYPRENSIANPQNPGILKYQEQSVIVQQKYFTKQIQYQNGEVLPKSIVPANIGSNVVSRPQNPYFNPQLPRDFSRNYSDNTPVPNRGVQTTSPIQASYPRYPMYQQKVAMQRFSMENQLREMARIPGYQSHPKYQESFLRYKELLRVQQNVDYESTVQDHPKVLTSQANAEIVPINLQYDQSGFLIKSSFVGPVFSNIQGPINLQSTKNVQSVSNTEVRPQNLQLSEQFKTQARIDNGVRDQELSSLPRAELLRENQQQYSYKEDQPHVQKYQSEGLNLVNPSVGKNLSIEQKNSRDFADKPDLDVRQFLANWDESEDEDGANANLPDVVLSNSTSVVESETASKAVLEDHEESENCSETEDCRSRDDCGIFENTPNETKPVQSTAHQIYLCDLPSVPESTKSLKQNLDTSDSVEKPVRTGTVIQSTSAECENEPTLHIMGNLTNSQTAHRNTNLLCREPEYLNENKQQEKPNIVQKSHVIVKKKSSTEEKSVTSIIEHIETYSHEANTKITSNLEEIMKNGEDSRSSSGKESSENVKQCFGSDDDLSESNDSDSTDSDSISSFRKSPKRIKGTEIHIDAQELSTIPGSPKSNSEMLDGSNLQKQNSFASEESHNPDDISLPDLPTSECTPISTTLNTPIHSDSEESSEPVIELTTPANPIEIIQNSPMLSFTHSPIKMELYEQFDEDDLTDKASHDALDFKFQANHSCDNDYDKPTDVSSHTTEQFDKTQNDENTFDSDCVEILSEKSDKNIRDNTCEVLRFAFHKETATTTDKVDSTRRDVDHQMIKEHERQLSNNTEQDAKSDADKLDSLSKMKDRLSTMPEFTKDCSKDDMAHTSNTKHYHGSSRWSMISEMRDTDCESNDNMTALNLVKNENKEESDPIRTADKVVNTQVVPKGGKNESNSATENQVTFTSTERRVEYPSSSEEGKIYTESPATQSNFNGSLNIPLIPGEDFEEPKMPVLPMEGNCLTKIIKNTSPITDLDVLGSDDEKLDKMDEIWMEVGSMETVNKVTDANINNYAECGKGSDREKSSASRSKLRLLPKIESKGWKNSIKAKEASKLFTKFNNESQESALKSSDEGDPQLHKSSGLDSTRKELPPVDKDSANATISRSDDTAKISQAKYNSTKPVPIMSKITINSSLHEDSKPKQDMCIENNATEIKKCKEKGNHINDIATKLWENARLFEPEQRKVEARRTDTSCGENSRDSSKKRIKLLKEYRKVKNKMNVLKPVIQSTESVDTIENSVVATIGITEQYRRIDAETIKLNNKFVNTQNILQVPDSLMMESRRSLDCQVIPETDVNAEKDQSASENLEKPEERSRQTLDDGEIIPSGGNTLEDNRSTVNTKDSITVEDRRSSIDFSEVFDTKVVSPIGEDINECAINLSKSANNLGLPETLQVKATNATNDSHNSYTSEDIKINESVETEMETVEEITCSDPKDDSSVLSESLGTGDSAICDEKAEDNKTVEESHVEVQSVVEANDDGNSCSPTTNLAKEQILDEDIEQKSIDTADCEEPEKPSSNIENAEDSTEPCTNPEIIDDPTDENCRNSVDVLETDDNEIIDCLSMQTELHEPKSLVAVDDREDQMPVTETVNFEMTHESESEQNDVVCTSKENEEETLVESFVDSEEVSMPNQAEQEQTSIDSLEESLRGMENEPEEKIVHPVENLIETTSVYHEEENVDKLSEAQQLVESQSQIVDECSVSVEDTDQDLERTSDIYRESEVILKDAEMVEKTSTLNKSPEQTELEESRKTDWLQNPNLELASGIDKTLNTGDPSSEVFGLENSFNCDFSNFDVAPNSSNADDADQSSSWNCSKEYARFEECERYKNPDNFVGPVLTSLETLDNLNTVPVYTTKDGKITYSPNPKFTYRALIMEAREREGYPVVQESNYGNPRTQEPINYTKNQTSVRKRKNSEGYSGSYSKQNYHELYEPRDHGESSTQNPLESRNRSYLTHNKNMHQSRDRNMHQFSTHNRGAEIIGQGKVLSKYKHREGYIVLDERNNRKNGNSDTLNYNNRRQYKQSKEKSSDSVRSRSRWDVKYDQNNVEMNLSQVKINEPTQNENRNSDITISTDIFSIDLKNDNESKDFSLTDKWDTRSIEKKYPHSKIEESASSSSKVEDRCTNDSRLLDLSNHEVHRNSVTRSEFSPDWENPCGNLAVEEEDYSEMKIPTKTSLDKMKEVCDIKTNVFSLYDGVDDIYIEKPSDINEKEPEKEDALNIECFATLNSVKCPSRDEIFEDFACSQEKLNIEKSDSITINIEDEDSLSPIPAEVIQSDEHLEEKERREPITINVEDEDLLSSIPAEVIQSDEHPEEKKIPELHETTNESQPSVNKDEQTKHTQKTDKFDESLQCRDEQERLNCAATDPSEIEDLNNEVELREEEIPEDKPNEFESLEPINEVQVDIGALKSNDQTSCSSEDKEITQELVVTERKEAKTKSYKTKTENKNVTTIKNVELEIESAYDNTTKSQSQVENYIAYSPTDDSPEDGKAIPKLVIKKTDSLTIKNSYPSSISNDISVEKVSDKEESGSRTSAHPKIPKILIRNAKSRPSTPSIEEITEKVTPSVTTKEDNNKVPKVKIRFDEKRPRSPTVSSNESVSNTDVTENKVPKMKIKLEDRLPKVIFENVDKDSSRSNDEVQKTIPKMKIKKLKGALRQIVEPQILPISIPRRFVHTELENDEEISQLTLANKDSGTPDFIQDDKKTTKDADLKKIPKLKIKRQSSRSSTESNRKRHSVSPIQSELKKVRKSSKVTETNDKKQSNKLSTSSEYKDGLKKFDSHNIKQSYELRNSSENLKYAAAPAPSTESVSSEQLKSTAGNISETSKEIPKVIIKRASPSAEFKCELSKGKRDAIIKNKRWQPEVKLQRSWVLDCMAKDLNLDKLTLKLATPDSILKKSLTQKKLEADRNQVKNLEVNINQNEKKLIRSKSTSDLLPTPGGNGVLVKNVVKQRREISATQLRKEELMTRKRCKSDLGNTFSNYSEHVDSKKILKNNNHFSKTQTKAKPVLEFAKELANSLNIPSGDESDDVFEKHREVENFTEIGASQSNNEAINLMETSEGDSDKTLDENMNSKNEIPVTNFDDQASDLNSEILSSSRSTENNLRSNCESLESGEEATNILGNSNYSANKRKERCEDLDNSVILKNDNDLDSVKKHMKTGTEPFADIQNQTLEDKGETMEFENTSNQIETVYDMTVISETAISAESDTRITNSDNLESLKCKNNVNKLDINDNPDDIVNEADYKENVSQDLLSHIDIEEQEDTTTLNENVLIPSIINDDKWRDAEDNQQPTITRNSPENLIDVDNDSLIRDKSSEDRQTIIEMLSDSPNHCPSELEINSGRNIIEENGICLYHEDAIPTQFELELEIVDNPVPDPLEVPMPQDYRTVEDFGNYSNDETNEDNHQENRISDNSRDGLNLDDDLTAFPCGNNSNSSQICSASTYQKEVSKFTDKEDTSLASDIDVRTIANSTHVKISRRFSSNDKKLLGSSDSLMKEVFATKDKLRKCLGKSRNQSRFKEKSGQKTATQKKQSSRIDVDKLGTSSEDSLNTLENHSLTNIAVDVPISSKEFEKNLCNVVNKNENIVQNQTKTEFKVVNKIKSERKHSKRSSKNNMIEKKYLGLPPNIIKKYNELAQIEGCLVPEHSSIDVKDGVESSKEDTTTCLKNSKYLIKNHNSSSDTRKKIIPELFNSKDSKVRSKSSLRYDVNSKYIGKSKSALTNTALRESDLDCGQSNDKTASNSAKHKYKSLKTSANRGSNSRTDETKFKFYKIPKIGKVHTSEAERLFEKLLQESQSSKESRMPILEPQVQLNGECEASELNSDQESSRSPPVITNQESRTTLECLSSTNEDREVLSEQKTTDPEDEAPKAIPSYTRNTSVVEIVNNMAYHEKATIKHRRYCTLCERWFPTVARHRRHLSGYQHRHTELTQRRTIHALFTLFTGKPCPRLQPPGAARIDCEPGELTPLQIAVQGVTKELNDADGNDIIKPTIEDNK